MPFPRPWSWAFSSLGLIFVALITGRALAPPPFAIGLRPVVAAGLDRPVYLTHAGDGAGRLFVVELEGRIRVIKEGVLLPAPYLDITSKVSCCQEQGLFSIAFDPAYAANGTFYVNYIDKGGDIVIARYVVADPAAEVAEVVSVTPVLWIEKPYFNHNGGQLQFGPRDGYLYIGTGDGGGAGDPEDRGQNMDSLLGKILRLDVRGVPTYTIPASNPFVGVAGVRPEIWAAGLRNPWRFSFDRATGDLYIGDVGALCYEEINFEPAGASAGGRNYGWRRMEGFHAFNRDEANLCSQPRITPPGLTLPIAQYRHGPGISVTGGYVYRGRAHPEFTGAYFYGDFGSGHIWALRRTSPATWGSFELLDTAYHISSFGEDEAGELYVLSYAGEVFQIESGASTAIPWGLLRRWLGPAGP